MSLASGENVGPYEILAPLGRGGMGEVYRARDKRLRREVAVKIILDASALNPDNLARFERETRAVAALEHPNIVAIHDTGLHGGLPYAVTELLEGETLAERLVAGPIEARSAGEIARQVAEGLAAAHAKGIVHRDVKPQNIFLTSEGRAKILDFGIARAEGRKDGVAQTAATTAAPTDGAVLGTVGYMAPEQVRGKPVDGRADIFALGAVLFEMLTGRQAFRKGTPVETLGAILNERPDGAETDRIPPELRRAVFRCLEKEPANRYQSARDLALDLNAWETDPGARAAPGRPPAGWTPLAGAVMAGVILFGLGVYLGTRLSSATGRTVVTGAVTRVALMLSPPLSLSSAERPLFAISPDGTRLVYVADVEGRTRLVLRDLNGLETRVLPGTEDATGPFFSPDGQSIGFVAVTQLQRLSLSGGPAELLRRVPPVTRGAGWMSDGSIVYSPVNTGGLDRLTAAGGEQKALVRPDYGHGEQAYRWPEILPGGKAILFTIYSGGDNFDAASIAALRLETGEKEILIRGGTSPRYAPTGHLIYARGGTLLAAPFDPERLAIAGPAVPVLSGIRTEATGATQYAFSSNGSLIYLPGPSPNRALFQVVRVDRQGQPRPLLSEPAAYYGARFSPDGRRISYSKGDANQDIWVLDLERGTETRLTPEPSEEFDPVWSPDGKRIAYSSERQALDPRIFVRAADGSGEETFLWKGEDAAMSMSWSPDGRTLALSTLGSGKQWDVWTLDLEKGVAKAYLATPYDEAQPDFSPDGRWIAYVSNDAGRYEVYARPFPGPGERVQISTEGGVEPAWRRDGREIFYRTRNRMMSASVALGSGLSIGRPVTLFERPDFYSMPLAEIRQYDVAPDGRSFVMIQLPDTQAPALVPVLVTTWFSELERKLKGAAGR